MTTDAQSGEADEALSGPITISLREARLVVGRILQLSPLDSGLIASVTDAVLYSEILGLGGFQTLLDGYAHLTCGHPPDPYDPVSIVCHGVHAWVVAPALADVAVEMAFSGGGSLLATGIAACDELAVLPGFAARHGVVVELADAGTGAVDIHVAAAVPAAARMDALMWDMICAGFPVLGSLWWRLYHLSNTALAPDNLVIRRHAGHPIVLSNGIVVGRRDIDDDTDLRLFQAAQPDSIPGKLAGDRP